MPTYRARKYILFEQDNTVITHTGTVVETTLKTIVIPGGLIGVNGRLQVSCFYSVANSANVKAFRIKFGGTVCYFTNSTAIISNASRVNIRNRGLAVQKITANNQGPYSTSASALVDGAVNTAVDQNIIFTAELVTSSADTLLIEGYEVEIFRA